MIIFSTESPNKFYYYGHVDEHKEWFSLRDAQQGEGMLGLMQEGKEWLLEVRTKYCGMSDKAMRVE